MSTISEIVAMEQERLNDWFASLNPSQQSFELRMIPVYHYLTKSGYMDLLSDVETCRDWLYRTDDPFHAAEIFMGLTLDVTEKLSPQMLKELRSETGKAGRKKRDAEKMGPFKDREDFIQTAMLELKDMVNSDQYPDWQHPEYLGELKAREPFIHVTVNNWFVVLTKKHFLPYLRENHPQVVKEH